MRRKFNPYLGATFFLAIIFSLAAEAQDQTDSSIVNGIGSVIPTGWKPYILTAVGVYELIVRLFPTVKNYSIIGWLIKLVQAAVPNKNATTPTQPHP